MSRAPISMISLRHILARSWILLLIGALFFWGWSNLRRIERVNAVSNLADWSATPLAPDPHSTTGYAGGKRRLVVPQHHDETYQWLVQTEHMASHGKSRLRRVDYDNAPYGRETHWPSPYRWWLGLLAWLDHAFSGKSLPLAIERTALIANPALHLVMVLVGTVFVAIYAGRSAAGLFSICSVTLFPLAGSFLPGIADHRAMSSLCALGTLLPLVVALNPATSSPLHKRWFVISGFFGGVGCWVDLTIAAPLLVGIGLGALVIAWINRAGRGETERKIKSLAWRSWSLTGTAVSLAAYLFEYFPSDLGWQLATNHPLYSLAWLGGGELLAQAVSRIQGQRSPNGKRDRAVMLFATAAVAALPGVMIWKRTWGFLTPGPFADRLSYATDALAPNSFAWISHSGLSKEALATLLPVGLAGAALVFLFRKRTDPAQRDAIALTLSPVLIALGFAFYQLTWWNYVGVLLLVLLIAVVGLNRTDNPTRHILIYFSLVTLAAIPGAMILFPQKTADIQESLSVVEVESLVERDLAHWLANRAGESTTVVLAPPSLTTTLIFHGGLRGLGSFDAENREGLNAAIRIVSASSQEEALALMEKRGVRYIVIPSWDSFLDDYARLGSSQYEGSFINALHRWALPAWLQPIPYKVPLIAGFENQSVTVFEVVEEQDPTTAFSRLAEYFVEMGQSDLATATRSGLQHFPGNIGALTALAQVEWSLDGKGNFETVVQELATKLSGTAERTLAWDRRIALAVVLAQGRRLDLAKEQVQRCLQQIDEPKIRALTTEALFRLQLLCKKFALEIPSQSQRRLAFDLLTPEMQQRIAK